MKWRVVGSLKKNWLFFISGGVLNTALTYSLYLLLQLVIGYRIAYILAYIAGILFSYVFNSVIVYRTAMDWKSLCTYPTMYLVQFFSAVLCLEVLIGIFGVSITWAPLVVAALLVPLTYTTTKLLLTRERSLKFIFSIIKLNFRSQRLLRHLRPFSAARPAWRKIVHSLSFPEKNRNAIRVLVASGTGSHWAMSGFESVLGAALKLRGASVEALLCDGILPACQECDVRLFPDNRLVEEGAAPLCRTCFTPAEKMFSELGIIVRRYGTFLPSAEKQVLDAIVDRIGDEKITEFTWRGITVGEHAVSGALRFFGRGSISGESFGHGVARQYLRAALYTAAALDRMLTQFKYDVVIFHHGIYVPQGIVGDVCRLHGIRVVNWNPAYRECTFLFSHGDTYHKTMIEEPSDVCFGYEWNEAKEFDLMAYLESRRSGSNDWISFQRQPHGEAAKLLSELGIASNRPIIGVLTNVMWDAQLHFKANAFRSMLEWIFFTIEHFSRRKDVEVLIRIHPAEVLGTVPSRQRVLEEIQSRWPTLPAHIHIVSPDDPKNTYTLMSACDTVLVYGTKMSIELPCWGIPVVVAGEAWVRGKGFTTDVSSPEEYQHILSSLPMRERLSKEKIQMARRYAHHIFHRRMIPVKFAKKNHSLVPFAYKVNSLEELAVGVDPGLDIICDGILSGSLFLANQ